MRALLHRLRRLHPRGRERRGRRRHGWPTCSPARTPRAASDGAAGLLASGSSYSRAFPRWQPPEGDPPRAVAFSGFVPGYSGGGGGRGPPPPPSPPAPPPRGGRPPPPPPPLSQKTPPPGGAPTHRRLHLTGRARWAGPA